MKKILSLFAAALLAFSASAQQKIGHLNSESVLQQMPEYKQMSDAVDKKKGEYSKTLEKMYQEYEMKQKELQDKGKEMMEAVLETKIQEIQDLQKRIGDFEQKAQTDLQKFAADLMKPLNDKYIKAVSKVAKEQGYSYIIDLASGAVAYYQEGTNDVTSSVLKELGVTGAPAAGGTSPAPAAGSTAPKK
jgi:outer membrane protein